MALVTETIWQSSTGAWNAAASWTRGVPDGTTVAKLDGTSVMDVRTGLTGATAKRLIVTPDYTGDIASPGAPLEITITSGDSGIAVLRGRGKHYIEFASGSFAKIVANSTNRANAGILYGELARSCFLDGKWVIANTADLIYQLLVCGPYADVTVLERTGTEAMCNLIVVDQGKLINERESDSGDYNIVVGGGYMLQKGVLADADDVIKLSGGGVFDYQPKAEPSATPADDPEMILASGVAAFDSSAYDFGVARLIIGPYAEVRGGTIHGGGPATGVSEPIDLREEYP